MFRISLGTLMLLVLVVGGGLGWKANRAHAQRQAVAAIKAAGGGIIYDFQYPNDGKPRPKEPPGPRWLRSMLGDEYFQEVAGVSFSGPSDSSVKLTPTAPTRHRARLLAAVALALLPG